MMKALRILCFTAAVGMSLSLRAQDMDEALLYQIAAEGKDLYQMELLSWLSSDLLREKENINSLRGFVAYKQGGQYRCIYWNGAYDNLEVVHTFSSPDPENDPQIQEDDTPRRLSPFESLLYDVKMRALLEIRGDPEFFVAPPDTRLSLHFIEDKNRIKAYAFLGTAKKGLIPLGNDYLMVFDKSGELISRSRIHPSFIPLYSDFQPDESGKLKTFHSTLGTSVPYITPTDIAVLLLYSGNKQVHEHHVLSDNFFSLYQLGSNSLMITRNEGTGKN